MKRSILRNKAFWLATALCLLPVFIGLIYYDRLPESMAIHFGPTFEPDGYAPKLFAVIGLPLLLTALNAVLWFLLENSPKGENVNKTMLALAKWIVPVLSCLVQLMFLAYALGKINLIWTIPLLIGLLMILIGNYLPKCRQNYIVGIKLPWTLNSKENWNRTNRLSGKLMVVGGFILLITSFLPNYAPWVVMAIALVEVVAPTVYSYILYRNGV